MTLEDRVVGALPRGWLARLRDREAIEAEARALVPLAGCGP